MPGFGRLAGGLLPVLGVSVAALAVPAAVVGTFFGFATAWWLTRRLKKLTRASEAWSRGDFSTLAEDRSKDELGQLSRELDGMAGQIEGLLRTQGELAASEARNGFARDLHDSVKQQVYATALHVDTARTLMQRDPKAADDRLVRAKELLVESQKELNVLIRGMRPAVLEDEGLAGALRDHAAMWSRGSGIPVEVRVEGERETTPEVEHTLFRVAQEALANVARHSGADHAEVSLTYDRDAVALRVADDGRGFEPSRNTGEGFDPAQANGGGFGLGSMHKRVSALGGRCDVDSVPGGGTRVVCVCPLDGAGVEGENA
jgi:NarL family two-component system sensor histidine kinase LiaS